jgi:7-cyano-7-deazaguanine synthase
MSQALVVFSGGQDSTTVLYWALKRYSQVDAITFDYGQRHRIEIECAQNLCRRLGVPQQLVNLDFLRDFTPNALTHSSVEIRSKGALKDLPSTFVPGRNALFLTLAAAAAIAKSIENIVIGVCQTDYSGYPDCREAFVKSMQESLSLAMDHKLTVHTPLMHQTKAETFQMAKDLGVLESVLEDSHTCYEGNRKERHPWGYGCGKCPACELRKKGYNEFLARPI